MSDFKNAFRQAVQSKVQKPSKEQLKAIREASKATIASAAPARAAPAPPMTSASGLPPGFFDHSAASSQRPAAAPPAANLPPGFFDSGPATSSKAPTAAASAPPASRPPAPAQPKPPGPTSGLALGYGTDEDEDLAPLPAPHQPKVLSNALPRAAPAPSSRPAAANPAAAALPKGFFDDKESEKKMRAAPEPKPQEKEQDWDEFQAEIARELEEQARQQAAEAEEEARDKLETDEFEHLVRLAHVGTYVKGATKRKRADDDDEDPSTAPTVVVPDARLVMDPEAAAVQEALESMKDKLKTKKAKMTDMSLEALAKTAGDGGSDDESEEDDELLDWRFKK